VPLYCNQQKEEHQGDERSADLQGSPERRRSLDLAK